MICLSVAQHSQSTSSFNTHIEISRNFAAQGRDERRCEILIPNRTFLVRFGGISGEFGRAMVRILARRSRAKIPMARPNEPDMPPTRTKKVRLGILFELTVNSALNYT